MTQILDNTKTLGKPGLTLHNAARYDLLVWLMTLGRVQAFRDRMLRFARLRRGETVLDVGCGTGSLAIAAKRQVGTEGEVYGLDASPEMIARAQNKARRAGVDVEFKNALAQLLPFPDARFDVVLTTLMLHHLSSKARQELAREIRRILKPGGRVLAIDFGGTEPDTKALINRFHRRHGHVELKKIIALLDDAGMNVTASGPVGLRDLNFALATVPHHD